MKAVVKYDLGPGKMRVQEMPDPVAAYDQVVIEVKAASICSSDMHYWKAPDTGSRLRPPVILGHEGTGIVTQVGDGVHHVKVGDRVVAETTLETCHVCDACMEGSYNNCRNRKGLGSSANGYFAEYVVALGNSVHKLPDNLSFEEGALLEPLCCTVRAVTHMMDVKPYHHVLVSGAGPIGLFAAQVAKACGATVIQTDTTVGEHRLELSRQFGIDRTVNVQKEKLADVIADVTKGRGVDYALDATAAVPAIQSCIDSIKPGGQFMFLAGVNTENGEMAINVQKLFGIGEIGLLTSRSTTPLDWYHTLRLAEMGKIHLKEIISHQLPLDEWETGFNLVESRQANKVVFNP
ncbi:alcohol dehydrogenase catalytic domain-containing protein [Eubacteriales bacterium OttesenSCG-928-N14]|nr:alcohol dehydrogenase catalytic domain-containing protein [Eubacteriales bacterium OttesenSCG-928-N14]